MTNELNLREVSIKELFNKEKCTFQVPIYQRNYAWTKDEIEALVNDVFDAYSAHKLDSSKSQVYYIGTLVSYRREDDIYEVIDGQQRLTTLRIILKVLGENPQNKLTYRARKKSTKTLDNLNLDALQKIDETEKDIGIESGLKYAEEALKSVKSDAEFKKYFLEQVHIIHYIVPCDIDLNHYFEVMNSRGEQLEKHEIVKANLMSALDDKEKAIFNKIWQATSQMSVYIQDSIDLSDEEKKKVFSNDFNNFLLKDFSDFSSFSNGETKKKKSIDTILKESSGEIPKEEEYKDSFQPIIDFPNFLLIVLKITILLENKSVSDDFVLDDKMLLNEFKSEFVKNTPDWVKKFAYNLLKAKFFLDNYVVHHASEDETEKSNPWQLQTYSSEGKNEKRHFRNLCNDDGLQNKLVQLLSMFEVSFTAKQRKNYLFYCLYWLMKNDDFHDIKKYCEFVESLADKYFFDVYLVKDNLNEINTPKPNKFDGIILSSKDFIRLEHSVRIINDFNTIFGNGSEKSKGIPLFIFNYMDYKIWKLYVAILKGKEKNKERKGLFIKKLGCSDFGLDIFDNFYFSRTRQRLEHYFPQANVKDNPNLSEANINCFGNYAMIGAEANSSGSNWSPKTKLDHYLDKSGKVNRISVASLKFWIMMQMCKDNQDSVGHEWEFNEISTHQNKMLDILFDDA